VPHPFLSPEWIVAAQAIRDEYRDRVSAPVGVAVRANLVIADAPGGEEIAAHLAVGPDGTHLELGHLDAPDVTLRTDFATAKAMFADRDGTVAMQSFMAGKIRVEGDTAKLMVLMAQAAQQQQADPLALEIADRVRAITTD
jgi:hypothetical protein